MSKAEIRLPNVSLTSRVRPSGVITEPFGNIRSFATTVTVPSGSTRDTSVVANGAPPIRS